MNFNDTSQPDGGSSGGGYPLAGQNSIYSFTFDEFQNSLVGHGKDFGSMNMEELLKSIWIAEENQAVASSTGVVGAAVPTGNLKRQGSVTLPRTLSQKTVDEVWKDVLRETIAEKNGLSFGRQHTLSEMTLEEFLVKAGVVREDVQPTGTLNTAGLNAESFGLKLGSQESNQFSDQNNAVFGSVQQQFHQPQPRIQPLFPKQGNLVFSAPAKLTSDALPISPQTKRLIVQGEGILSGGVGGSSRSHLHSEVVLKSKSEAPMLSTYRFGESGSSRRPPATLEKVVERRRKRMIKNRDSAARSRARKQAYTLELEAEVAKLREVNQELRKKQEEIEEMQKNEMKETMNKVRREDKRSALRRTLTGPL